VVCVEDIDQVTCQLLSTISFLDECFNFNYLNAMSEILIFLNAEMIFRTRKLFSERLLSLHIYSDIT